MGDLQKTRAPTTGTFQSNTGDLQSITVAFRSTTVAFLIEHRRFPNQTRALLNQTRALSLSTFQVQGVSGYNVRELRALDGENFVEQDEEQR